MAALSFKLIGDQQQRFAAVVRRWVAEVRAIPDNVKTGQEIGQAVYLPIADLARQPIDLRALVDSFPACFHEIPDATVRQRVRGHLQSIAAAALGASGAVQRGLSDLAVEVASRRVLLVEGDRFDVSAFSVLTAVALLNLFHLADKVRKAPNRALPEDAPRLVEEPLALALARQDLIRPGDLWFLDLAARTVRAAHARAARQGPQAEAAFWWPHLPRFTSLSLLHKLIEADRIGAEIAKRSNYKLWVGLTLLLADPGAGSLRAAVVGEVAHRVGRDRVGLSQAALFRFLEALVGFDEPAKAFRARLLIATLLWEILEQDPKVIGRLLDRGKAAEGLLKAVEAVERKSGEPPPSGLEGENQRLAEILRCLREYDQYQSLRVLRGLDRIPANVAGIPPYTGSIGVAS